MAKVENCIHYTGCLLCPRSQHSHSTRKKKQMMPTAAMMMPGTTKERPQAEETQTPAMSDPKMLPTEVCEFQMPMIKPLLVGTQPGQWHWGGCQAQQGPGLAQGTWEKNSLSFAKPVSNACHDSRPASRLHQPIADLARDGEHQPRHCFEQPGWKTATPILKLLRKHLLCLVFALLGQSWSCLHGCHG